MDLLQATMVDRHDIAAVFCGINRDTLQVEFVAFTKDRELSRLNRDGSATRHKVERRQIPESQVRMLYGLIDVLMVPISLSTRAHAGIVRLETKAADLRAGRSAP